MMYLLNMLEIGGYRHVLHQGSPCHMLVDAAAQHPSLVIAAM